MGMHMYGVRRKKEVRFFFLAECELTGWLTVGLASQVE